MQNTIAALKLNCQLFEQHTGQEGCDDFLGRIKQLSEILANEVEIQRILANRESHSYTVSPQPVRLSDILNNLRAMFSSHPAAQGKALCLVEGIRDGIIHTDPMLLQRILVNMLINAFEATDAGGEVRMWLDGYPERVIFNVWNNRAIAPDIALRIFQRNFSTKQEFGRGLGTYSIKLFAETYLDGKASFSTSKEKGTIFSLELPK